jgi:excisionase family DNA binding protein
MNQANQNRERPGQTINDESVILTVGETAKLLRLSKTTTYDQIRQGTIPYIRMGKRILVPRAALMRRIDQAIGPIE